MSEDMGLVTPLATPSVVSRELANELATPSTGGWRKVDPAAFQRALKIIADADQADRKACMAALRSANAEVGIMEPALRRTSKGCATKPESTREVTLGEAKGTTEPNTSQHLIDRGRVEP